MEMNNAPPAPYYLCVGIEDLDNQDIYRKATCELLQDTDNIDSANAEVFPTKYSESSSNPSSQNL